VGEHELEFTDRPPRFNLEAHQPPRSAIHLPSGSIVSTVGHTATSLVLLHGFLTKEGTSMSRTSLRYLGIGGALAPIVLVAAVLVAAAGRPEYHHATQAVSELGEVGAARAAVINYGGFVLYGLLVIALSVGLHAGIRRGAGDWLGPVLLGVYGLAYVVVAVAPCDPGCSGASTSLNEEAHFLTGRVVIMTSLAAPFVLYPRVAKDAAWTSVGWLLVALPVMGYIVFLGAVPGLPFGWVQRLWIACTLVWVMALGLRLARI
jgi:hypothetical protein